MAFGSLERPATFCERTVLVRITRTFYHIAAARHVIIAIPRAIQFVGIVPTVVLFVTTERVINAPSIRAMVGTLNFQLIMCTILF